MIRKNVVQIYKQSPLAVIAILALMIGGTAATWFWSSAPITTSIIVDGEITAVSNFNPTTDLTTPEGTWIPLNDIATIDTLIPGSQCGRDPTKKYLYIRGGSTNVEVLYLRLVTDMDSGIQASAEVNLMVIRNDGTWDSIGTKLGSIALDGTETLAVRTGPSNNPLWLMESNTELLPLVEVEFTINAPTLPPGTYYLSVVAHLGDTQ